MEIIEPIYYHREYSNDINPGFKRVADPSIIVRLAKVALPFFSLYRPISYPLTLVMGGGRVWSSSQNFLHEKNMKNLAHTLLAVSAIAGTLFAPPLGLLISTVHDLAIESEQLVEHLQKGERHKAIESCSRLLNSSLYLALFFNGGTTVLVASLSAQVLAALYRSVSEYKKGNYLESVAHLAFALLRGMELKNSFNPAQKNKLENRQEYSKEEKILRISSMLRENLTENEMNLVIDKIQKGEAIEPSIISTFAATRGDKKAFSTLKIREIVKAFEVFEPDWSHLEESDSFWKRLHQLTFGNYQESFGDENEHLNYEVRRIASKIEFKKKTDSIVSKSFVDDHIKEGCFVQIKDRFWHIFYSVGYGEKKILGDQSWEENFDIGYQTKAFAVDLAKIPKHEINSKLAGVVNKYPKNSRLNLNYQTWLKQNNALSAINKLKDYLVDISVVYSGYYSDEGLAEYQALHSPKTSLDACKSCPHLKNLDLMFSGSAGLTPDKAIDLYADNCKSLEFIKITYCAMGSKSGSSKQLVH